MQFFKKLAKKITDNKAEPTVIDAVVEEKPQKKISAETNKETKVFEVESLETHHDDGDYSVVIEKLSPDYMINRSHLYEITDVSLVGRLNEVVRLGVPLGTQGLQVMKIKNIFSKTQTLYTSDIPIDKLVHARGVSQGYRAMEMGKDGIQRNAVLREQDTKALTNAGRGALVTQAVLSTISFVVHQYYLTEINKKLQYVNNNIQAISDFQQREFRSKILALMNNVYELSTFSSEVLSNDELRKQEIAHLNHYKYETSQLLYQVNSAIEESTSINLQKVSDYQKRVYEMNQLIQYQTVLTSILEEVSKLTYILNHEEVSLQKCYATYDKLFPEINERRTRIPAWHKKYIKHFEINLSGATVKKQGLKGLIVKPLTLLDKKWDYETIDADFKKSITNQRKTKPLEPSIYKHFFEEDVELIIENGKYYYYFPHLNTVNQTSNKRRK